MKPHNALLAVVLVMAASTAHAQPKPALVQDRDEPGRSPFHVSENLQASECVFISSCAFTFGSYVVPAGKRLVITQVSVVIATSGPEAGANVELRDSVGTASAWFRVPGYAAPFLHHLQPLTLYVDAGSMPLLTVRNEAPNGISQASLTGYLVSLP